MSWDLGTPTHDGYHVAGADLSAAQYLIVSLNSTNGVVYPTTVGAKVYGVLQANSTSGALCDIVTLGYSKCTHDGTLTPGAFFQATSSGVATTCTTAAGLNRIGVAATVPSTAVNTIFTALVSQCGISS